MEAVWHAIEQLGVVRALKSSFFVYPVVNALHVLAIGTLVSSVIMMDLKVLGAFRALPAEAFVRLLRRVTLTAFVIAVLTGALLFSVRASEYAEMPLFWIKMGLILAAGANFLAYSALRAAGGPTRGLAVASIVLWPSILLAGRFLGFV